MCDSQLVMDQGLFKSRSFRVGWGPYWSLTTQTHSTGVVTGKYYRTLGLLVCLCTLVEHNNISDMLRNMQ